MASRSQILLVLVALCAVLALVAAGPDSAGQPPLPGPGLSYGGIPYGSMSGNVAEFFKRQASSAGHRRNFAPASEVDFAPIEQWL